MGVWGGGGAGGGGPSPPESACHSRLLLGYAQAHFYLAFAGGMAAAALLGVVLERVAFRPLQGSHPLVPLISAIGASIFLQSLALLLFGPNDRPFPLQFNFSTITTPG